MKILIADDHPIVRHGVRQVLAEDPGMEVVGEAKDGDVGAVAPPLIGEVFDNASLSEIIPIATDEAAAHAAVSS